MNFIRYKNTVAVHPGYYIKEYMDSYGMTKKDFAMRLGTTAKNLTLLIKGEQSLSPDMAKRLFAVTGISTETWTNLQRRFDSDIEVILREERLTKEAEILDEISCDDLHSAYGFPNLPSEKVDKAAAISHALGLYSLAPLDKITFST